MQAMCGVIDIQKMLESDLENELQKSQYLRYLPGHRRGGLSYEFATIEFLKRREAEGWRWI